MKKAEKILSFIISSVLLLSFCAVPAFAELSLGEPALSSNAETKNKSGVEVKICADKGSWQNQPENSLPAILNCPSEYISIDIKVTRDGIPVLMEDETVERTCVDENGKSVNGKVSDYTFEGIQKFYLRNRNGGSHNEKTDNKVPSLNEAAISAEDKIFVLDFNLSDLDAVYDTVYSSSLQTRVIFRIDGKTDEVISALSAKEKIPETILKYDGNIIFSVNKIIKKATESGINTVQLGSKNQYGVIFYSSVENKIKKNKMTAAFSMTDGYSAKRDDSVSGWDDVISHGYSFIETDYPDLLSEYVAESEKLRQRLKDMTAHNDEYRNGTYPENLIDEYNKACSEAENVIKSVSSQSQLAQAYTRLVNARSALNISEGTSTSQSVLNFSADRIITVSLCFAAVAAAQVFFYKRRKS